MNGRFRRRFLHAPWLVWAVCLRPFSRVLGRRPLLLFCALLSLYAGARGCGSTKSLRIGTFNVHDFGPDTDIKVLTELLAETDSDVMAIQEIRRPDLLPEVAVALSKATKRRYQAVASACGGKRTLHVGYLYDADQVRLDETREFPELREDDRGSCFAGARAGLLGVFSARRGWRRLRYSLLVVHFPAGGSLEQIRDRQEYWARALSIAGHVGRSKEERVIILGDVNSTDYRDDQFGERRAIHHAVEKAGFSVLTPELSCTEYYQPQPLGEFLPSHLDHIVGSMAITAPAQARIHGFCSKLRCAPSLKMPAEYYSVSDHCPVTLDIR